MQVKNIAEQPDKKFIETFICDDYEILTDTGWSNIAAIGKTVKYDVWELKTRNHSIKCADTHIIFVEVDGIFQQIYVEDLLPGDIILTEEGKDTVVSVNKLSYQENMYDLQLNDENHRYYTNGILSHNSIWLANFAANGIRLGYNTAVISLEMRDRKVIKRMGANLLNITMREYAQMAEDQVMMKKRLGQIGYDSLQVPGKLYVKEFPTSSAGVPDIERWLLKMEELKGIKFKVIILDYINILKNWRNPNSENMYMKIKQIAEDLRAMAMRNNWAIVTATQINRCLTLDTLVEHKEKGIIEIKDLVAGDEILGPHGFTSVTKIHPVQNQKIYQIKTKSGKTIKVSEYHLHPVSGSNSYVITKDLKIGDKLFVKNTCAADDKILC